MKINTLCTQAFVNLTSAKLRSFLAVLGILVGTASIVALISCSQLATAKALAQFKSLGTNLLSISVYPQSTDVAQRRQEYVSVEFWRRLPELIPDMESIAPYALAYQTISYQGKLLQGVILGADESLAHTMRVRLAAGHFVSFVDSYEHFCVIGSQLAQQISAISLEDPLDKTLQIGQNLYTIIGVAHPWKENGFFNEDINKAIIIPIAGIALVSQDLKINNAVAILKPNGNVRQVIAEVTRLIHEQAPKLNAFIRSAQQIIDSMENQGRIFTWLLAVIGSIALVVGGIGVMNVMLVSVGERKKEIGIRKAVGARNQEIQALFLMEATLLSLLGGGAGVGVGFCLTWIVAYFNDWPFAIHWVPFVTGFTVSVTTGLFFGFYPAKRAARLEPIASLRSEV